MTDKKPMNSIKLINLEINQVEALLYEMSKAVSYPSTSHLPNTHNKTVALSLNNLQRPQVPARPPTHPQDKRSCICVQATCLRKLQKTNFQEGNQKKTNINKTYSFRWKIKERKRLTKRGSESKKTSTRKKKYSLPFSK